MLHHPFTKAATIVMAIASPLVVSAERGDPLSELTTQVLKESRHREGRERKELYGAKWLVPGSNFAGVFIDRKGPLQLLDWLGYVIPGFSPSKENGERKTEYVRADRIFTDEHFKPILVSVLVPHPRYASAVELGLIEAFYVLQPPRLHAIAETPIEIRGALKSTLYQDTKGDFSLLIKLPRNAVVNLSAKDPGMKEKILDLAKKLDFERLAQKLQT